MTDDLGALGGIYCAGHEGEIVIIRNDDAYAGDAYALDIMADDDVFAPSKRAMRRARQATCNAVPAPIPEKPSRQVRRALARAAKKGGAMH